LAGLIAEARGAGQEFSLEDLLTLHEVRLERRITTARAAELFQVDQHEARATLNRLADRGLVEARGDGKGRSYHLAAAIYSRLGESAQYVRARGFDDIQQEQMVLTFVDRHSSITRREAAELCQLDSERASRLLRRLRDEGKLELIGEKRSSRYVKPAAQAGA
jgi:ATP-dependent DNA helicase RecG